MVLTALASMGAAALRESSGRHRYRIENPVTVPASMLEEGRGPSSSFFPSSADTLVLAVAGVAVGPVGALWMGRALAGLLYETTPRDPIALAMVAVLLLVVAVVGSVVPARRATRIQPVDAFRDV